MPKTQTFNISIIFDVASGRLDMSGPSDPLVCGDVLTRAVQLCLVNAAKQRGPVAPKVETAGAGLLHALPPVTNGK